MNMSSTNKRVGEEEKLETYDIYVECCNCNFHDRIDIKKGNRIDIVDCPNCGCDSLIKS